MKVQLSELLEALIEQRKSLVLILAKQNSYLFVNRKETLRFTSDNKNVNFSPQFCLGSISNGFIVTESRQVSLNRNMYDFSVNSNSIDKFDISSIQKYLKTTNNIR